MDRRFIAELHAVLAPEGGGGLVGPVAQLDAAAVAATANEYGARFAALYGPHSTTQILDKLQAALALPPWSGRDWEDLENVLAHPASDHAGPMIIAWLEPDRLDPGEAAAFRSAIENAAEARAQSGDGALVMVIGPRVAHEVPEMPTVPDHVRAMGKVHHVALIVRSLETALGLWRDALGLELETIMDIEHDRVRIAFLAVGESKVELVQPTDDTTGVARFLESRGEGFHHVCFEVENLAETLLRLEIDGLELIDTAPRRGAEGPVAFIHPRSCHGVLVELIEAPGGPAWTALGFS
jgi:methylmalonyl-CoA/ethylmalonyl-CoA epimerase